MFGNSAGYARSGPGPNQANVTINVRPVMNSEIIGMFDDTIKYESAKHLARYPLSSSRNMLTRGDLTFKIVGSRSNRCFSDFSGIIVPSGSVDSSYFDENLHFDVGQSIYDSLEFCGVFKESKVHTDGGALLNENNANTPGSEAASVYARGTDTIVANSPYPIKSGDILIWEAPPFKSATHLAAGHRFLATVAPLTSKHSTKLWIDSQYAFLDYFLTSSMMTSGSSKNAQNFLKTVNYIGGAENIIPAARLAQADWKRDILTAMSVIHVLHSVGKLRISNIKAKKEEAFTAWVLASSVGINAAQITAAKQLIDDTNPADFDDNTYQFNGNGFTVVKKTVPKFFNLSANEKSVNVGTLCSLLQNIGLYDKKTGTLNNTSKLSKSELLQELAAVMVAIPIHAVKENFTFNTPSGFAKNSTIGVSTCDIASNFYSDLKSSKTDSYARAHDTYKSLNKRVVGIAVTSSPGNPSRAEIPRGSLNAPQVDMDILACASMF